MLQKEYVFIYLFITRYSLIQHFIKLHGRKCYAGTKRSIVHKHSLYLLIRSAFLILECNKEHFIHSATHCCALNSPFEATAKYEISQLWSSYKKLFPITRERVVKVFD